MSDAGTGISFSPATRFSHRSADTVQALGDGITLDRPLAKRHAYGSALVSTLAATGGYQGFPAPNQRFGGVLSSSAGSIELLDASGKLVVDAMVYGSQQSNSSANGTIASPELAVLVSDQGKGGCIVVVASQPGGGGPAASAPVATNRSVGRFPDGMDTDSECTDFKTQTSTMLPVGAAAGVTNIKVAGVAGFDVGQTIAIDTGENMETATIKMVGSAGGSTTGSATEVGATVLPGCQRSGF